MSSSNLPAFCKHGHPWNKKNTRITKKGGRVCRACDRARKDGWWAQLSRRTKDEYWERKEKKRRVRVSCQRCYRWEGKLRTQPIRLGMPVILCERCWKSIKDDPFYAPTDLIGQLYDERDFRPEVDIPLDKEGGTVVGYRYKEEE